MRLQSLNKLPVFYLPSASIVGEVLRPVMGDDFQIVYMVIDLFGQGTNMIAADDFKLSGEALLFTDRDVIKSYNYGVESTIYELKIGDLVFDINGKELGWVSDFLLDPKNKKVWGIEVTDGILRDLWGGRKKVPLNTLKWPSKSSVLIETERR